MIQYIFIRTPNAIVREITKSNLKAELTLLTTIISMCAQKTQKRLLIVYSDIPHEFIESQNCTQNKPIGLFYSDFTSLLLF